jgi:hypothetical protein
MIRRQVRAGKSYRYVPCGLDLWDARTDLKSGDVVTVVKLPGCPAPNTMGHCHVNKDGRFAGLVLTNSLQPLRNH